jgi:hypothetical protein
VLRFKRLQSPKSSQPKATHKSTIAKVKSAIAKSKAAIALITKEIAAKTDTH